MADAGWWPSRAGGRSVLLSRGPRRGGWMHSGRVRVPGTRSGAGSCGITGSRHVRVEVPWPRRGSAGKPRFAQRCRGGCAASARVGRGVCARQPVAESPDPTPSWSTTVRQSTRGAWCQTHLFHRSDTQAWTSAAGSPRDTLSPTASIASPATWTGRHARVGRDLVMRGEARRRDAGSATSGLDRRRHPRVAAAPAADPSTKRRSAPSDPTYRGHALRHK